MRSFKNYINEWKFSDNNRANQSSIYKYRPKDRTELNEIILQRLKENVEEPYLLDIDTSNIENMSRLFAATMNDFLDLNGVDAKKIKKLDLHTWLTHNVANMCYMFGGCKNLKTVIHKFNTHNVTDMSFMFADCESLEELDLSSLNAPNLKNMREMFVDCYKLKHIDLSNFKAKSLEQIEQAFSTCLKLEIVDLSNMNTEHVTNMRWMFYRCEDLKEIIGLENLDRTNVDDMTYMFHQCYTLNRNNKIPSWYDKEKWH